MAFSRDGDGENNNGLSVVTGAGHSGPAAPISSQDKGSSKLIELKQLHRDLDEAILAMTSEGGVHNQLELSRLKKRKLMLRDQISKLEDEIVPDIIA